MAENDIEGPTPTGAGPFESELNLHATCVAYETAGVLILGASGSGKSELALSLMAFGADLVSDDRTILVAQEGGGLRARAPTPLAGMIEARGVGLLAASARSSAFVRLIVDLDCLEQDRLPQRREITLLGQSLPLIYRVDTPHFAAAVLQYLKGGRRA